MAEALDPNLRGLIRALVAVLIREVEREMVDDHADTEPASEDDSQNDEGRRLRGYLPIAHIEAALQFMGLPR